MTSWRPSVQPHLHAVIERCQQEGRGWTPQQVPWSDYLALRLLIGAEDLSEWSADVQRALAIVRAKQVSQKRDLLRHRDVKAQIDAGYVVRLQRVRAYRKRQRRGEPPMSAPAREAWKNYTEALVRKAMRTEAVADAGRRARVRLLWASQRTRKPPEVRSVADGWHWRDGRPATHDPELLLLRTEVWRDMRVLVQGASRATQAGALAAVLLAGLKTSAQATYQDVELEWRGYEDEQRRARYRPDARAPSSVRALTRAMRAVMGTDFRSFETQLSQARAGRWAVPHRRSDGAGR